MLAAATLGVAAVYLHTIDFGFNYDDYHVVRPWTWSEAAQVLRGSWDPTRIEVPFYRPVSAWWYALRFHLFGLNAPAQRFVTLAGMIVCAVLTGLYVWRDTRRRRSAFVATSLYAVHPLLPYSQGAWLTNQMHLLASLAVLTGLLIWQRARGRTAWAWWPVFAVQVVGFGVKEDTLMLLPLVLTLTVVRARLVGDVRPPRAGVWVAGATVVAGLPLLRHAMLGQLGGYGTPTVAQGWANFRRGLDAVRLAGSRRPLEIASSVFVTVAFVGGSLAALFRRTTPGSYLLASGFLIVLFFNVPFVFVTKAEQRHLLALGSVIALTGAIDVLIESVTVTLVRRSVAVILGLGALTLVPVARSVTADFAPCSGYTLYTDGIVTGWWVVPPEIKKWLEAKPDACRAGSLVALPDALPSVTWAYDQEIDETGRPFRWTSDHAMTFVALGARQLVFAVRGATASAAQPIHVRVQGPATDRTLRLTDSQWVSVEVPLRPTILAHLRRTHRVDLAVSPTFVPRERDRDNPDTRHLGVQIRILEPR
jgi:hypothetical protein